MYSECPINQPTDRPRTLCFLWPRQVCVDGHLLNCSRSHHHFHYSIRVAAAAAAVFPTDSNFDESMKVSPLLLLAVTAIHSCHLFTLACPEIDYYDSDRICAAYYDYYCRILVTAITVNYFLKELSLSLSVSSTTRHARIEIRRFRDKV